MEEKLRFGVITYVLKSFGSPGKITIQKTLYFLQEALGVPLGYEYVMHYYGPYSSELDDNLAEMRGMGILTIAAYPHSGGWVGYEISLGKKADEIPASPPEYKQKIDQVVNFIKALDVQNMELCATIHFVQTILKEKGRSLNKESVIKEAKQLKPRFDLPSIESWYVKLVQEGLLQPAT